MLRLKLTHAKASKVLEVEPSTTLSSFCAQCSLAFSLASNVDLFAGFPPKRLSGTPDTPLSALLQSGTVVDVRAGLAPPSLALERISVPSNGNCLFSSVSYLTSGDASSAAAAAQRESVVAALLSEPDLYTEAVLGCPPGEYIAMIGKDAVWGGAIELSILSKLHQTELISTDIRTGHLYRFGEGQGYSAAGFLLYDGLHYDALAAASSGSRLFPREGTGLAAATAGALALAAAQRASGKYTDLAGFTLRCSVCGKGVVGQKGAVEHAQQTTHQAYHEYKAQPIAGKAQ